MIDHYKLKVGGFLDILQDMRPFWFRKSALMPINLCDIKSSSHFNKGGPFNRKKFEEN